MTADASDNRRQRQPSSSLPASKQDLAATQVYVSTLGWGSRRRPSASPHPGRHPAGQPSCVGTWLLHTFLHSRHWRLVPSSAVEETVLTLLLCVLDPVRLPRPRLSTSSCCLFKGKSQALALLTWPASEEQGPLSCQS